MYSWICVVCFLTKPVFPSSIVSGVLPVLKVLLMNLGNLVFLNKYLVCKIVERTQTTTKHSGFSEV